MKFTITVFRFMLIAVAPQLMGCSSSANFLCYVTSILVEGAALDEDCVESLSSDCRANCRSLVPEDQVPPETQPAIRCQATTAFTCTSNPEDIGFGFCKPLLVDGGFEMATYRTGVVPGTPGFWQGDLASVVTESDIEDTGIRSCDGARILRFDGTTEQGAHINTGAGEVFQVVDLMPDSTAIKAGGVKAVGSALFTRLETDSESDRAFDLTLFAFTGQIGRTFFDFRSSLWVAREGTTIRPEARNTPAWTEAFVELELPESTTHVLVQLSALEDVHNDGEQPEFDGHFVDAVRLELSR